MQAVQTSILLAGLRLQLKGTEAFCIHLTLGLQHCSHENIKSASLNHTVVMGFKLNSHNNSHFHVFPYGGRLWFL